MDKPTLLAKRQDFFQQIINHLNTPPSKIDEVLNQAQYYVYPNMEKTFINSEYGDMVIQIDGEFYDKKFSIFYSLWQLGDTLKVGIALNDDELQGAFASDTHNEVHYIWGWNNEPKVDVARGCVFYDWEFDVPNLYDNYKNQEKFILGVKHMHFRAMRILHDECQRIFFNIEKSENDEVPSGITSVEEFEKYIKNQKK